MRTRTFMIALLGGALLTAGLYAGCYSYWRYCCAPPCCVPCVPSAPVKQYELIAPPTPEPDGTYSLPGAYSLSDLTTGQFSDLSTGSGSQLFPLGGLTGDFPFFGGGFGGGGGHDELPPPFPELNPLPPITPPTPATPAPSSAVLLVIGIVLFGASQAWSRWRKC